MKEMIQKGAIESKFDTDTWFFKLCDSLEELDQNDYEAIELWIARQCIKLERLMQRQDCYEKDTVSNKITLIVPEHELLSIYVKCDYGAFAVESMPVPDLSSLKEPIQAKYSALGIPFEIRLVNILSV